MGYPRPQIEHYAEEMLKRNIKISIGLFNNGMLSEVDNLIKKGLMQKPYYINLVFNTPYQGSMRTTPENLFMMISQLPQDSIFNVSCVGRAQLTYTTMSMCLGGNARVGFEDNLSYTDNELAKSNAQFVARTARIARELGLEVASPDEARDILGIPRP